MTHHTQSDAVIEVVDEGNNVVLIFDDPNIFSEYERMELHGEVVDVELLGIRFEPFTS